MAKEAKHKTQAVLWQTSTKKLKVICIEKSTLKDEIQLEDLLGKCYEGRSGWRGGLCGACSYVIYLHFSSVCDEAAEGRPCDSYVFASGTSSPAIHRAFITHCPAEKACSVPVLTVFLDKHHKASPHHAGHLKASQERDEPLQVIQIRCAR